MPIKIDHKETVPTLVDIATLAPRDGFAFQGTICMVLAAAVVGSTPASAMNIDTGATVSVPSPNLVEPLQLTLTVENLAPVPVTEAPPLVPTDPTAPAAPPAG